MKLILSILTGLGLSASCALGAPRHIIIAYSPSLPDGIRQEVATSISSSLCQGDPGTRVTIVRTEPLGTVADVVIPEGSPILKQRRAAASIARTFKEVSSATNSLGQFVIPSVLDAIGRQWASQNDTVLLIGPALHTDARQPEFNFTTNWPSDGHLVAGMHRSPFSTVDRRHLLEGVGVYWIATDTDRMASTQQHDAVRRFWTLYIAMQGGTLVNFSSDLTSTFANASIGRLTGGAIPALDPDDTNVVMYPRPRFDPPPLPLTRFVTNTVIETNVVTITNELKVIRETTLPRVASGNSGIGIVWFSTPGENQRLDLDLYVWVPRDGTELFYGLTSSPTGRYFRDVQQSNALMQDDWRASYEFVELQGEQLPHEVWINVYRGRGPAQGEVRVQYRGEEHRIAFAIPAVRGNSGRDRATRSKSEHWLKINLLPLLRQP